MHVVVVVVGAVVGATYAVVVVVDLGAGVDEFFCELLAEEDVDLLDAGTVVDVVVEVVAGIVVGTVVGVTTMTLA